MSERVGQRAFEAGAEAGAERDVHRDERVQRRGDEGHPYLRAYSQRPVSCGGQCTHCGAEAGRLAGGLEAGDGGGGEVYADDEGGDGGCARGEGERGEDGVRDLRAGPAEEREEREHEEDAHARGCVPSPSVGP